jgi:hypothetical protein
MQLEHTQRRHSDQLDLLWGAKAIADFIGIDERQVWYQADRGYLPVTRQGRILAASKSRLRQHFNAEPIAAPPADQSTITEPAAA